MPAGPDFSLLMNLLFRFTLIKPHHQQFLTTIEATPLPGAPVFRVEAKGVIVLDFPKLAGVLGEDIHIRRPITYRWFVLLMPEKGAS